MKNVESAEQSVGSEAGEALDFDLLLEESGALKSGHFKLSSGKHSTRYVQCALLLEQPARARAVGSALAKRLVSHEPDTIVSPALGGLIIGFEVAVALDVPFRFTERQDGRMKLRRGFELRREERVAIVEDVVTTGRSTLETVAEVEKSGGRVVAVGAIIDRSGHDGGRSPFSIPFEFLTSLEIDSYEKQECPLCASGGVAEKPGSRTSAPGL